MASRLSSQESNTQVPRSSNHDRFRQFNAVEPRKLQLLRTDVVEKGSLKKTDIVIAVIGTTGTGKSTFIEIASGHNTGVGHELDSFTKRITAYRITFQNSSKKVVLVDTPGFDSTLMSDRDTLEHIAKWLSSTFKDGILLAGILYMHRITDNRMTGSPMRNLELLKKLCGEDALNKVVLVTTMWDVKGGESFDSYVERENALKQDYWKPLIARGSQVKRFMNGEESAWDILNPLTELKAEKRAILIQHELGTQSRSFENSSLGRAVEASALQALTRQRNIVSRLAKELKSNTESGIVNALGQELRELAGQRNGPYLLRERARNLKQRSSHLSRYHCRSLLLEITNDPEARQALCSLRDNDAQMMVNYMNLEIRDMDIFTNEKGRRLCSLFCKLAKSARTFPELFELSGILWDKESTTHLGGFAVVQKGVWGCSGQTVAIKIVRNVGLDVLRLHVKELTLWAHLSHPNVLPFYGIFRDSSEPGAICLVSPWMDNGNLHEYSRQCPQPERFRLLFDVVKGLSYLHKLHIVHGDLKGGNILVSKGRKALIADFGLSRIESTDTKMQTVNVDTRATSVWAASIRWTAPEVLESDDQESGSGIDGFGRISKASDIWAFGCVIYEVMSRRLPHDTCAMEVQVMYAILNHKLPERPQGDAQSDGIPERSITWNIIQECWKLEPAQRPTCLEVLSIFRRAVGSEEGPLAERPDIPDYASGTSSSSRFWADMQRKSQVRVDFSEIYHLLLEAWLSSVNHQ